MNEPQRQSRFAQLAERVRLYRTTVAAYARRTLGNRRFRLAAVLGLLSIAPVVAAMLLGEARKVVKPVAPTPRASLAAALAALDRGNLQEARSLAQRLQHQASATPPDGKDSKQHNSQTAQANVLARAGAEFVLGCVFAYEADRLTAGERKQHAGRAVGHLQKARKAGFPPGRAGQGLYLLGKCLYRDGRADESAAVLEAALAAPGADATAIHSLLASVYRRTTTPHYDKSLAHLSAYLSTARLAPAQRSAALLRKARTEFEMGDTTACRRTLDQIPPQAELAPAIALLRGQILMREADELAAKATSSGGEQQRIESQQRYDQAIQTLLAAQADPLAARSVRRATYLIGVCYLRKSDVQAALAHFERVRNVFLESPEGLAAALQEADMLRECGRDDEAIEAYDRALISFAATARGAEPWIPLADFRSRVMEAYTHYMTAGDFERSLAIADRLSGLFPEMRATELAAEAQQQWGERLMDQAAREPDKESNRKRNEARALLRKAGRTYKKLAQLQFSTRQYPDNVWRAARCFLEGHDFRSAAASFEEYLKYEQGGKRPAALASLGEASLALGRLDKALVALKQCIELYPNDAAGYRARLLAARVYVEKNQPQAAEALLRENLNGDALTPESKEWRDSLFTLGELLDATGHYDEAIRRLEEAVERYPDTREAIKARYLIAESYRRAAREPQERLATTTIETARLAYAKQAQKLLTAAVAQYEQLQQVLNRKQDTVELSSLEKTILRNSYFALGTALFDLGRYEDAIRAYSTATNRYQHDPEVLDAFVQIAHCYRRLSKTSEARGTIQQAKVVLNRIDKDARFGTTTNYSRREWGELLDWLSTL